MTKKPFNITSPGHCTGCSACNNICPVKAIVMKENRDGFLYPVIDKEKCTGCGLCTKTCPVNNPQYRNLDKPECMAVVGKDEVREHSASGGVFAVLAEHMLKKKGFICGAAFQKDFSVGHRIVSGSNEKELMTLRGTKYVQSDMNTCYADTKELLENDGMVLFSGLPCQVAGLYAYLGKEYDELYTIDLLCHGVPSYKVFRQYVHDKFPGKEISSLNFRDKRNFSWSSNMSIEFTDGTIYRNDHAHDSFYRAFLSGMAVRESCSSCPFSKLPRQGDLTIGDFWGISNYRPDLNDSKGTSVMLINNEKGSKLFSHVFQQFKKTESMPLEYAIKGNPPIISPFRMHPARTRFFNGLGVKKFDVLVEEARRFHFDVAIVDLWYGINYGSILTAYALYEVVKTFGLEPVMLYKPAELWNEKFEKRDSIAGAFIYKRCNVSNPRRDRFDWRNLNDNIDSFIVGSDVVWNYDICGKGSGYFFFLDFVNDDKRKISYASSFGSGYNAPEDVRAHAEYYLKKFDYVSVRETEAVRICRGKFGVEATQVLDPVFLCDRTVYEQDAAQSEVDIKEAYIFAYILGPNKVKNAVLSRVEKILRKKVVLTVNPNELEKCRKLADRPATDAISVEDWLKYIQNCDYFVGDSFHGLCFSLIFHKQFVIAIDRNMASKGRFISLLSMLGMENRIVYQNEAESRLQEVINSKIDYDMVEKELQRLKAESMNWLRSSLFNVKTINYTDGEILRAEMDERFRILQERIMKLEKGGKQGD